MLLKHKEKDLIRRVIKWIHGEKMCQKKRKMN